MKNVFLKGVQEEDWVQIKSEAAAHDMKLAQFISYVVREHAKTKHDKAKLHEILSWRSGRSSIELEQLQKKLDKMRHNFKLER